MVDVRPRGMAPLAWMLGGYGLFTICLVLAAYVAGGGDAAMLVATGAASVAVPIGGLIALAVASWQTPPGSGDDGAGPSDAAPIVPAVPPHGSVFVVGNGSEAVSVRVGTGGVTISTGAAAAAGASDGRRGDGAGTGAVAPVIAPPGG